jgi:subtilisin family serine protease
MTAPEQDPHVRPQHPYPTMPEGIRICDDETAAGDWFFYRDRQLVVHTDDLRRVQESLLSLRLHEDRHYQRNRSTAGRPYALLEFHRDAGVDTIDLLRTLRYGVEEGGADHDGHHDGAAGKDGADGANPDEPEPAPLRVWPNHVIGLQYHTNWGSGDLPSPRPPLSELPAGENLPGTGVRVGVLDTGIMEQPWFGDRWSPAAGRGPQEVADRPGSGPTLPFGCGHGTFVAGIVLQHAPGADLVVDRVDSADGCIDDVELHERLAALLTGDDLDVLNLSLGGYTVDNMPLPLTCDVLTDALDRRPELVVVASAGNEAHDRPLWPAALRRVVGVGAVDAGGGRWSLSNFGEWVDAWSLGDELPGPFLQWPPGPPPETGDLQPGPRDPHAVGQFGQRFEGWAAWSGTSFAAARVSGAVAAELKRDGRSPREVVFDLVTNAAVSFEDGGLVVPATYVT